MLYFAYYAYAECFAKCPAAHTSSSSDLLIFSSVGSPFSTSVSLVIHCVISLSALPHARVPSPLGSVSLFPLPLSLSLSLSLSLWCAFIHSFICAFSMFFLRFAAVFSFPSLATFISRPPALFLFLFLPSVPPWSIRPFAFLPEQSCRFIVSI